MERETQEEADRRREAALASTASLRPNFKPKSAITESQLSKFQELHRRRLQIKAKSKVHKRDKGGKWKDKSLKKAFEVLEYADQEPSKPAGDPTSNPIPESRVANISSGEDNITRNVAPKTRHKLYWGLKESGPIDAVQHQSLSSTLKTSRSIRHSWLDQLVSFHLWACPPTEVWASVLASDLIYDQ